MQWEMSSPTMQARDEKEDAGARHMLMNRGPWVGITQLYDALKTWQGWPFYLAKRASGQPLESAVVLVVWMCQRWIDMTCQNGHAKTAPELRTWTAQCFWHVLWFCKPVLLQEAVKNPLRRSASCFTEFFPFLQPLLCRGGCLCNQIQRTSGLWADCLDRTEVLQQTILKKIWGLLSRIRLSMFHATKVLPYLSYLK